MLEDAGVPQDACVSAPQQCADREAMPNGSILDMCTSHVMCTKQVGGDCGKFLYLQRSNFLLRVLATCSGVFWQSRVLKRVFPETRSEGKQQHIPELPFPSVPKARCDLTASFDRLDDVPARVCEATQRFIV